jgi:DNA-directed RNA polymerase subunit M/transcription elongation factor TFIIS
MSRDDIHWSSRVPKWKLRRLYESEAQGMLDEDLLEDVGLTLLLRCEDILAIEEARQGRVKCPRCAQQGAPTMIKRTTRSSGDPRHEVITCPTCGWQITWGEYMLSFKRKQLNSGGATQFFAAYVNAYAAARTPSEKMLAIDRLIHEFHYSVKVRPDQPTRPAGVNLINGNLTSVIAFLDELSGLTPGLPGIAATRQQWQDSLQKFQQIDWKAIVEEQRAQNSRKQPE